MYYIHENVTTIATQHHHHREFIAAMDLEADFDFAFNLQIQEAIIASRAFQPNDVVVPNQQTLKHKSEIKDNVITEIESKRMKFSDDGGASTSKTKEEKEVEVFRVYFKGLVSKERIGVSKTSVTLAVIGVAICDSTDVLVCDMKKGVEIGAGNRVSRRSIEEMALIEALNYAVSLGLKRIVLCFDYHTLYQYVSGQWQPRQQKVRSIVDQVNLIRKSFTHCEPSLVTQKGVKFAPKLAREAMNYQIEKAVEAIRNKRESCVICSDEKPMIEFFLVEGCNHQFCYSCMKQHAEVKLLNGMVPKCPQEDCDTELRIERCEKFLTPKLTEMMRQQLKEASIPVTEKVYCPYPKCSTLMSKSELLQLSSDMYENGATCHICYGKFCVNCRVPWHSDMNCEEYKKINPTPLVEESKLKNLAAKNLWRQCIKCNHMIELTTGCNHMTCRCGCEFCYSCGAEWKNKKATCGCPIWDEGNIIHSEDEDEDLEEMGF
uniref:uncharacterized protein LOC122585124 n=1 Tax=Erigeron canadensis TaxID=72917 RepID=UPI001CB8EA37|nr:uncharacterized protein LOC122585124 [Erigeron canadensis]XP_043613159.1 uncharacterized protein LOC122585124 [Erigeron canadensis]